ncbi:phospholipase D family protein [Microbulbifer sp. YPW16]|uniref:phospholipase D family protein n=1 Tax=Microbulbifer sp. YPW16 TaxID=2904242 RepID=UPI001E2D556F|nr:phospholipase D family protein [Microbulbifer sp. YPW16]UHQ53731.1 phospholipase D family protein [Microbulbifer sp. YPW16]
MLLDSSQFAEQLFKSISSCHKSFKVCSAFIKLMALHDDRFTAKLNDKDVEVIARWQKHDLLSGASDLDVYALCKRYGWKFGIDLNLHGKIFLIDDTDIFLGSANLTQKGLHIGLAGNHEFGTKISAEQADLKKISEFINSEVTWMTDELYEMISNEVQRSKKDKTPVTSVHWSRAIDEIVQKPVKFLWVRELLFTTPSDLLTLNLDDEKCAHDFELLGLNIDDICKDSLRRAFKRQRLYRWMHSIVRDDSLSFGAVSARLHAAILDDPKPYRIDIKTYNRILFEWAEFLDSDFEVCQPNYSQVLSLKR